jgi:hypothetical protein
MILEVTPLIGCANMCEYCPQTKLIKEWKTKGSEKKEMFLEDFVNYLSTIPTDVDIHFTGYVEVFLAQDAPAMVHHAYNKGHKVMLNTTLVGLSKDVWDSFSDMSFKDVHLHLPSGTFQEAIGLEKPIRWIEHEGKKTRALSQEYLDMIHHIAENPHRPMSTHSWGNTVHWKCHGSLHPQLHYLLSEDAPAMSKIDTLYQLDGVDNNKYNLQIEVHGVNSRAMNNLHEKKEKVPPDQNIRGKCPRVTQNVLLPDGKLSLCCQDYGLDAIMGDLSKLSWDEYQNSERAQKIFKEGADICDFCEEYVEYVDEETWDAWRKVKNKD